MDIVFQVLLNSKLQVDVLGRVWDLSDIDKDGMLDKDEFAVVSKLRKLFFLPRNLWRNICCLLKKIVLNILHLQRTCQNLN